MGDIKKGEKEKFKLKPVVGDGGERGPIPDWAYEALANHLLERMREEWQKPGMQEEFYLWKRRRDEFLKKEAEKEDGRGISKRKDIDPSTEKAPFTEVMDFMGSDLFLNALLRPKSTTLTAFHV